MSSESLETKATILVVDDISSNRMVIEGHLEAAGYSVTTADSGARAIELFTAEPADLVLLDILMPGMDGFATCRRLRALPGGIHTPIVFLTALEEQKAQAKAHEAGADDFLTKPVRALELLLRVRSLLRIRHLHAEIERKSAALRKATEARADRSDKRYRTLFTASSDAVIIHDLSGRVLEGNDRATEWLGYDHAELLAISVADLYPAEALKESGRAFAAIQAEGRAVFEIELVRKDGSVFPAEVSATLFELDGKPTVQALVRDITVRRQTERQLEQSRLNEKAMTDLLRVITAAQKAFIAGRPARLVFEDLLTPLLDLTSSEYGLIGEVQYEDDGTPYLETHCITNISWNDETRRLASRAPRRSESSSCFATDAKTEPSELCTLRTLFGAIMTTGEPMISNDLASDPSSGSIPPGHPPLRAFLGLPLFKGKTMVGLVGIANRPDGYDQDVIEYLAPFRTICASIIEAHRSEQRRLASETSLREIEAQLRQAKKLEALGSLAGGVAHDFNNQLTMIIAYSRFVLDDLPVGHPSRDDLSEVLRAADSATQLTSQLLSFARRRPVEPQVVDIREAVGNAQKMLRRTMGESIELVAHLGEETLPVIVDPGALDQIIFNLAVNARDAMPAGGTLTIEVATRTIDSSESLSPGKYVAITVRDTGTGIADDVASRVFEPFFSTKGESGTGLGLATCYGIAKQAHGEITIDTELGRGTVFTVLLPRADGVPKSGSYGPAIDPIIRSGGVALVVEDQPSILRLMSRALRDAGVRVIEARTAEEGFAAIKGLGTTGLNLLVSDVVLPGQSGVWLMERIREKSPGLPVLLISGYMGDEGPITQTDDTTVFLPKPFSAKQLMVKAAGLLGSKAVSYCAR